MKAKIKKFEIEKGKWYVCIKDLLDNYANKAFRKGDTYLSTQDGSLMPSNSNVPFEVVCPDTYFRDWTIQDAKAGDVLACPNDAGDRDVVFIFKNINSDEGWVFCFCASDANGCFCTNNDYVGNSNSTNISPATKEQRDILFQKMHKAGYEWDAEKKELKKIEQKPVWSEEDETMWDEISDLLWEGYKQSGSKLSWDDIRNWVNSKLKSLRPQNTWKPSEEQLYWLKWAVNRMPDTEKANEAEAVLEDLLEQLKKLKG